MTNKNYESIRNNYASLHLAIYIAFLTKVQNNISIPQSNEAIKKDPSFCLHPLYINNHPPIVLEDWYQIRLDYVKFACKTEGEQQKFQIIQESALIAYTGRIIWLFYELLHINNKKPKAKDQNFEQYCINKLQNNYCDFIEILGFLRHTLIHNTSYNFTMENTDDFLSFWIKRQKWKTLQLETLITKGQNYQVNITLKTTKSDIEKEISPWKVQTLFDIISPSQIYMLLEVCMNFADEYFKQNTSTTPSE